MAYMCRARHTRLLRSRVLHRVGQPPLQELRMSGGRSVDGYVSKIENPRRIPANGDPKMYAYEVEGGVEKPRDLYGFSLSPIGDPPARKRKRRKDRK